MREILFRGKRLDNGEWIEGHLLTVTLREETAYLIFADSFKIVCGEVKASLHALVDPATVGQYTGLMDKQGERIFEGDVLLLDGEDGHFTLSWDDDGARFVMDGDGLRVYVDNFWNYEVEVIDNVHDNPELIGGGEDG